MQVDWRADEVLDACFKHMGETVGIPDGRSCSPLTLESCSCVLLSTMLGCAVHSNSFACATTCHIQRYYIQVLSIVKSHNTASMCVKIAYSQTNSQYSSQIDEL